MTNVTTNPDISQPSAGVAVERAEGLLLNSVGDHPPPLGRGRPNADCQRRRSAAPDNDPTDTIAYVVTDSAGLSSTSTRTVIVQAAAAVPNDASSTSATTAAQ